MVVKITTHTARNIVTEGLRSVRRLFCFYATTNHKDKIYVSNSEENRVIVTDLELNMIKIIGTHGKSNDQFDHPRGVSYYKSYIYICDYGNIRIQILNDIKLLEN